MHRACFLFIGAALLVSCASQSPLVPGPQSATQGISTGLTSTGDGSHRLWSEWTWYISKNHDEVDVVPKRLGGVHLNALKLLETGCSDCVQIIGIKNNGDSTIDLTVRLRHPFPGHPEYTGFDVKGIVMFNGSFQISQSIGVPPNPDMFRISWRLMGDPELLNPDGYTLRWSPWYDSGSSLPMFNYWPGKYSSGTPTANLNAFLNFYTTEERHMFIDYGVVTRVYHIFLPPGPVTVGYAVEACWEPPTKIPVIDPAEAFPVTANQDEPYHFRFVLNNDEPITEGECCGENLDDPCSDLRVETLQWYGPAVDSQVFSLPDDQHTHVGSALQPCLVSNTEWQIGWGYPFSSFPDGTYRGVSTVFCPGEDNFAYSVFDWTVDLE